MTPEELANAMARHILGMNISAEDETCQECVALAKQAILAERERCAKIAEEMEPNQCCGNIAAAIRGGEE